MAAPCQAENLDDAAGLQAGKYLVVGWDPGNSTEGPPDYQGNAVLSRWGDIWRYRGIMDEMIYAGAGIYEPESKALSLSFTNGDGTERGVTLLHLVNGQLYGSWAMDNGGDGKLGTEIWTRIK